MSNTPHTLGEEFPGQLEAIHALKAKDAHFAGILDEYDAVNDQIHRAENRIDTITEEAEAALRKRRLALKDQIATTLAKAG
ncbi:YdcH family protein [Xanthobacter sp. TB0139]|uniref:YdcH family protein n=1 Tax=Xanthobacter sp. TB0139 TaxID=3459178 RepID=UPI0040394033